MPASANTVDAEYLERVAITTDAFIRSEGGSEYIRGINSEIKQLEDDLFDSDINGLTETKVRTILSKRQMCIELRDKLINPSGVKREQR